MFGNSSFDLLCAHFSDQFEADGGGFLYRRNLKGQPVRVTRAERDRFVEAFSKRIRYGRWAIIPLTLVLLGLIIFFFSNAEESATTFTMYSTLLAIVVLWLIAYYWIWNAPARELKDRPSAGAPKTKEEVRKIKLARISYGKLALSVPMAAFIVWRASERHDIFHGWGILWLILLAASVAIAAIQAFRKWSYERE